MASLILIILSIFLFYSGSDSFVIYLGVILTSLCFLFYGILKAKSNIKIVLYVFLTTYIIAALPHFLYDMRIVPYDGFATSEDYLRTQVLALIFVLSMEFSDKYLGNIQLPKIFSVLAVQRYGLVSSVILCLFMLLIIFLSFNSNFVLSVDENKFDTYVANLSKQSGAIDYFLILYTLALFRIRSRPLQYFIFILGLYYVAYTMLTGFRVSSLQMMLLMWVFYINNKMPKHLLLLCIVLGVFSMQAIDNLKVGSEFSDSLLSFFHNDEIRTNQTEIFYSTNVLINSAYTGLVDCIDRIYNFMGAVLAIVLPGSLIKTEWWHPTLYNMGKTGLAVGGGGMIFGHFYYWLSLPGVLISGFLVTFFIKTSSIWANRAVYPAFLLIFATFPRWMTYEPIATLFRFFIYFFVLDIIIYSIQKCLKRLG